LVVALGVGVLISYLIRRGTSKLPRGPMKLPKVLSALAVRFDVEPMEAKLVEHLSDSFLLGLYDSDGMLDHVGFTSTIQ
jgi:hypothetical protein